MSTLFSVNLNKLALIRNSRGTDYPNLLYFVKKLIDLGVKGFTVHPRPDERHIRYQDVYDISEYLKDYQDIEFNIEGNPNEQFLKLIREVKPHQCTLVPDSEDQLTSDHGFDIIKYSDMLSKLSHELEGFGTRCAVFIDPDIEQIKAVIASNVQTIEMYTEEWARAYEDKKDNDSSNNDSNFAAVKQRFDDCINLASENGMRVNAGHDLSLTNLGTFCTIPGILEVSIGHALISEALEMGMQKTVKEYLKVLGE